MKIFTYNIFTAILVAVLVAGCFTACTSEGNVSQQKQNLHFNSEGKFKIVQFTDIHYVIGTEGSAKSLRLMKQVLDAEKPDLVVFTGDIVTCKPQKQGWSEVLKVVIDRQTPYAITLGNHDDESDWTRSQIFDYVDSMPYSLSGLHKEQAALKGVGNYILPVVDKDGKTSALLYIFDSNAYNKVGEQSGYDWFGSDQVAWYYGKSRAFTGANGGQPYPALAFFHIPLQEYSMMHDTTKRFSKTAIVGTKQEAECPGLLNSGMFNAMVECGDVMGTFVGHDHDNDYIGCLKGVCLAYGRFTGSNNTYNKIGSGARIIELRENQKNFETWIRDEQNQVLYRTTYSALAGL